MGKWRDLYNQMDMRNVGNGIYHFINVVHKDEFPDGYEHNYNVSGCEVDLWSLSISHFDDVYASCGPDGFTEEEWEAIKVGDFSGSKGEVLAEFCYTHGYSAPVYNEEGNNLRKLMREAKRALRDVLDDSVRLHVLHGTPVNRIGNTAFQYMRGETFPSGLPTRFQWDYRRMKSTDPMAFAMGFSHGIAGHLIAVATRKELSSEYLRGYREGSDASFKAHRSRELIVFPEGIIAQ